MTKKKIIMDSALELFCTQGFDQTSIQQITERAGISKGAFYLTFKSKDELILSLIEQFMNSLLLDIEQSVNSIENNKIEVYLFKQFTTFEKNNFFPKLFLSEKTPSLDPIILEKTRYYHSLITEGLMNIIQSQYPKLTNEMLIEHTFIVQSLTASYGKLFMQDNSQIDKNKLVANVYEKIDILARQSTLHYIKRKDFLCDSINSVSIDYVLKEMEVVETTIDDDELKEAITILKNNLLLNSYPPVITQALISLLKTNIETTWIALLIEKYFKGQK